MSAALVLDGISKTRGEGRRAVSALRGVSLALAPGEIVLLEGPSGAGKTTLLGVAAGLLTPDSGSVTLAGCLLSSLGRRDAARHRAAAIGLVFQRPSLLPELTAAENVHVSAALAGVPPAEARVRVAELLGALGVAALADRRPHELSGGEEQRIAVARALVHRPAVVFADEPTANLDAAAGRAVAEGLARLVSEAGAAALIATHDARLAPYATRRVRIEDGRLGEVS